MGGDGVIVDGAGYRSLFGHSLRYRSLMQIFPSFADSRFRLIALCANNARAKCSANFLSINNLTPLL
jgi:hypothetical protein